MDERSRRLFEALRVPEGHCEFCTENPYTHLLVTLLCGSISPAKVCETCLLQAQYDENNDKDDLKIILQRPLTEGEK